ncbi:MAG: type IV pilus twitching motility protein PilT [Candidatus Hydrogenedentota bacterium]|jgi:twitching motility protein PilT|uniref:Twitching motility protein PilT n=1 Tax=Sumerlaea chitinivorans TaxID=2250252 RepID=A0A2Z4Y8W4_SUMC1|nr:Twitching motility protein PilT [Candidatus Sumerlaea chitinivorans]RMH25583.1 MAG: type IV pilus twitching motility protein PilT [Candidatus Hydrogenedentota bacterium]GIX43668.1 MAG: twitching motility protein PilT [Candidatus Sumerlaea sp.]
MDLADLLIDTRDKGASDLHLTVGAPPCQRIHGRIVPMEAPILDRDMLHTMIYDILTDDQKKRLERDLELDFALEFGEAVRFRANVYFNRRGEGAVFRVIPTKIKTLDELGMPPVLKELCHRPRGLILVTGPTGSGKSTTLAAMIDYINETREDHIITIEDPIEFVHQHKKCLVNQREVGVHTHSFANALRSALREDPDIILVGELRDLETISLALTAAETGHLVFGTLHTSSAPKTVDRLIDVFPPEQQEQVRVMFSESVQGVICQTLIPRLDGRGRVCAMEIMVATPAVRSLIREAKTHQLPSILQVSAKYGMQTLDQVLKQLVYEGVISKEQAITHANNKFLFDADEGFAPIGQAGTPGGTSTPSASATPTTSRPTPAAARRESSTPPPPQDEEDWMKVFGKRK